MERIKEIISQEAVFKTVKRISYEIIEKNENLDNIVLVGILSKGLPLAQKIQQYILEIARVTIPCYALDISAYRDDINNSTKIKKSDITLNVEKKNVIIVDDVLYTGRSVRAAMDALVDYGRPSKIQLAILIDRGHRELPIRADYVGKNIPTSQLEKVIFDVYNMNVSLFSKQ